MLAARSVPQCPADQPVLLFSEGLHLVDGAGEAGRRLQLAARTGTGAQVVPARGRLGKREICVSDRAETRVRSETAPDETEKRFRREKTHIGMGRRHSVKRGNRCVHCAQTDL